VRLRGAELLATTSTTEEATEIIKAYVQLYREDARYGERTSTWTERVGLTPIKQKVIEDKEERKALIARLDEYTSTLQDDPWKAFIDDSEGNTPGSGLSFKDLNIGEEVISG